MLDRILTGKRHWRNGLLATDAYKFSMAASNYLAGRGEELESFHASFRKGKPLYVPIYIPSLIENELKPVVNDSDIAEDVAFLSRHGFNVDDQLLCNVSTIGADTVLSNIPKMEYCMAREPMVTMYGNGAAVSWIEPLLIGRLSYMCQVATAARYAVVDFNTWGDDFNTWSDFIKRVSVVTCMEQKRITIQAIEGAGISVGSSVSMFNPDWIKVDEAGYYNRVMEQGEKILRTGVKPERVFEVGLRSATCMEQHIIALAALKELGFNRTSNVYGAYVLDMIPVGTMGHEGVQRWDSNDELAFEKHIAAMPKTLMLLDTNDTTRVGLPAAIRMMKKYPERQDGCRPDSGDIGAQFRAFVSIFRESNIVPRTWTFEDGLVAGDLERFESLRMDLDYPAELTLYGLGGFFIAETEPTGFTRDKVGFVYKLGYTERFGPTMKFGNEPNGGKTSIPGIPVVKSNGATSIVAQYGEHIDGYRLVRNRYINTCEPGQITYSPETKRIVDELSAIRERRISEATL